MLVGRLCIFFIEVIVQIFCQLCFYWALFAFLKLSCQSSLYILGTDLLSDMCFADIFSNPVAYPFIFLTVSFEEQLLVLKSNLSIFCFMCSAFLCHI